MPLVCNDCSFGLIFAGLTFVTTLFLKEIPLKRDEFYKENG